MADHYRRKQTRRNINAMYLDNYMRAKTYTEKQQLEQYMTAVTEAEREAEIRQAKAHCEKDLGKQIDLFDAQGN